MEIVAERYEWVRPLPPHARDSSALDLGQQPLRTSPPAWPSNPPSSHSPQVADVTSNPPSSHSPQVADVTFTACGVCNQSANNSRNLTKVVCRNTAASWKLESMPGGGILDGRLY